MFVLRESVLAAGKDAEKHDCQPGWHAYRRHGSSSLGCPTPELSILIFRGHTLFCWPDFLAPPFCQSNDAIYRHITKAFHKSAGPAHFAMLNLTRCSQSKVNADVAVRNVASAAANLINLLAQICFH